MVIAASVLLTVLRESWRSLGLNGEGIKVGRRVAREPGVSPLTLGSPLCSINSLLFLGSTDIYLSLSLNVNEKCKERVAKSEEL